MHDTFLTANTAKNVNDPSIFGDIKDITVTAKQTISGYQSNSLFTITNNANDTHTYSLDSVEEGVNTFTAVATTVTTAIPPTYSSTPKNTVNSKVWSIIDAQVSGKPYAVYNGSVGPTTIDVNVPMTLNIPMNTTNGRFIAYFRSTTTYLPVTVTPYINEVAQLSFIVNGTNDSYWIWNDSNCVNGKTVRFQCLTKLGTFTLSTANIPNITIKSHTTSKYAFEIPATGNTYTTIPHN
jgi:hypothetical protein